MYDQMDMLSDMGPLKKILGMLPIGMTKKLPDHAMGQTQERLKKFKFIMDSMTEDEMKNPKIIKSSRIKRIARGSGTEAKDVKALLKYYNQVLEYLKIKGIIWSKREIKHHIMLVDTDNMVEAAQIATKIPGIKYSAIVESTPSTFDDIVDKIAKVGKILIEPRETFTVKADLVNPLSFSSRDIEFAASARIIGESSEIIKPNNKIEY